MEFLSLLAGKMRDLEPVNDEFIVVQLHEDAAEEGTPDNYQEQPYDPRTDGDVLDEGLNYGEKDSGPRAASTAPLWGVDGTRGPAPRITWREVACNDGTALPRAKRPYAVRTARSLNNLRVYVARHYGVSVDRVYIVVNSWYRTKAYNARIGGVSNSRHIVGDAADVNYYIKTSRGMRRVPTWKVRRLAEKCYRFRNGGVGSYTSFVHLDTRGYRARWSGGA